MNPLIRRLFFWFLTTTFFVTTPIIILFLMGYRYSFERGVFVYTGSVSIEANPTQNLVIHIDGAPVSSQTNRINNSYHVEGVAPGKHILSLSAPGFSTWSKEITVRSGISTEFWNVLLAREQYGQVLTPFPEGSLAFFPSPGGDFLAVLSEKNGETLITLLETTSNLSRQIFSTTEFSASSSAVPDAFKRALRWSPRDDTTLLISLTNKKTLEEHTFIIKTDSLLATDFKDIIRVPLPHEVRWHPSADRLLFLSDKTLFEATPDAPLQETLLSENIENFDSLGNTIIALETNTGILHSFPIGNPKQKEQITTAPPENFSSTASPHTISVYDETRIILFHRETGTLYLYNKGETDERFEKLSSDAKGFQFSDDGKKLLYWTDWEIFAFFTREWEVQPVRNEGDRLDIGRFGTMITDVQWMKNYEHVLFSSGKDIRATELDDRGGRNTATILTLANIPLQFTSLGTQNKLLFLLPAQSDVSSSTPTLSTLTFPEPLGLFGFGR